MNILVLKGQSRYDVLRIFCDTMIDAFTNLGHSVDIFDGCSENLDAVISHCKMQDYDFVFCFNAILIENCDIFLNNPDTIVWSFLVDHPYYHHLRLLSPHKNHIVSCIDHAHVQYLRKHYPHIQAFHYVPHGGNLPVSQPKEYLDREINVAFMGSYSDTQPLENTMNQLPDLIKMVVNNVIKNYYATWTEPLENLYDYEFRKYQLNLSREEFAGFMNELTCVDQYLRALNRELILNTLTSNGVKVDVFGAGWEHYACPNPENLCIHGQIGYTEVLETMCNSKIVLNPLPLFTNGSHERVFTSMLCGAVCVSEKNLYLQQEFTDNENITFFNMAALHEFPKQIQALLDNPEQAAFIAQNGQALATQMHTWQHRAQSIIDIVHNM